MSPKRRQTNKHLPARVYLKHASYFYVDINNKWHNLGKAYAEAMKNYAELTAGRVLKNDRMGSVFDRYLKEIAPSKANLTYKSRIQAIKYLRAAFGELKPSEITPVLIYQYMDIRAQASIFSANKEKSILSNVLSYAIRWGLLAQNPCRDVKSIPEPKRERYIEDWEFKAIYNISPPLIKAAMKLAYATALRQSDILNIRLSDLKPEGLEVKTSKTGTKLTFEYGNLLQDAISEAKRLIRPVSGLYLLCNRKGQPYTRTGFKSIWQRVMNEAMERKILTQRFTFHDIRSKAGTDAERQHGREYARQLLGHTTQKMTARYIKGGQIVRAFDQVLLDKKAFIRQ